MCGCVQYFMPRTSDDVTICNRKDYSCYSKVNVAIDMALNESYQCSNCLPGCFEIYYKPSVYTAELGLGNYSVREKILMQMNADFIK